MRLSETTAAVSPHPTNDPNLFVRDLPPDEYQAVVGNLPEDGQLAAWTIFDKLLCDADGNRLEDYPSEADAKRLTVGQMATFMEIVHAFNDRLGKRLG